MRHDPELVSVEVQGLLESAPIIISKGQGNCETLNDIPGPIYFLLKVKCEMMSRLINAPEGNLVLKKSPLFQPRVQPGNAA